MEYGLIMIGTERLRCTLSPLGASIASAAVIGRGGKAVSVALSSDSLRSGVADPSLAGRTIAPCAGRIRDGEVSVGGGTVRLTRNEGQHHLHGGVSGTAGRLWELTEADGTHAVFRTELEDGADGYPGRRVVWARYSVAGGALTVRWTAETDRPTWFDCTNHVYWDLGGAFDGSAAEQELMIDADAAVMNDALHLPVRIVPAEGAFDFSSPARIADKLAEYAGHAQLVTGRGYNNAFLLRDPVRRAARLYSPATGIRMNLTTDQPALVLYTGGFLDGSTETDGRAAVPHAAVALEAQGIPDVWHLTGREDGLLLPGVVWERFVRWEFTLPEDEGSHGL